MLTRTLSGAVMTVILVIAVVLGGPVMGLLTLFISLVGYMEMEKALGVKTAGKAVNPLEILSYLTITVYYVLMGLDIEDRYIYYGIVLAAFILLQMVIYVLTFPRFDWKQIAGNLFSTLYAPLMLGFMYATRIRFEKGAFIFVMIFVASWISDTFAYFAGVTLGKHKLAPILSPKKSIEGSIGGVVGSALVGGLYALVLYKLNICPAEYISAFAIIGGVGSVISQIGDLAASAVKRQVGIKDYGNLIPGHGGIMDRFDSVIVTAPIIYYLAYFLIG